MSNRGGGVPERVISLAPKVDVRSEAGDPLDRAGKAIVALLHRAASDAEAKNQQALAMTHQLSAQPRAAEDRIRPALPGANGPSREVVASNVVGD
jgi:hypothetical protein